jgi:hypothetical protein
MGEPVPRTKEAATKLAKKGSRLLERYWRAKKNKSEPREVMAAKKRGLCANI